MRKRNYTVTIRMNNEEYNLLQNKEPDVCRYSQSASGSYYKYQSDCKKAAYRWRSSK